MIQLKISQKSMVKVLDKDAMYDKYYYKSLGFGEIIYDYLE